MNAQTLFVALDLAGVFACAISGATAALQRRLDLFGVVMVAFITAVGGGVVRDLCIGATPPVGLSDWSYLVTAVLAALLTIGAGPLVERLAYPVLLFDALGLSVFAVTGAHKALAYGHNYEVAILLGTTTAVGGGIARDVLLNRVPAILRKEIYATAALLGASILVLGEALGWSRNWLTWLAIAACFVLRLLSLRYGWHLRLNVAERR
ncbi:trimeric intracellular cation channel family protein [Pseudomonas sp. MAP12]|uniref:Trimeric intracellular cation channel family protein n=1 Tax=Geopseudomonas aromaticivorans TaxID=2849492 RepID=A0ABS6N176_9GAMM|nr:trimeric intracellular cation channel family protein [Pseudomonas aromaticivorans]MBV2134297.1 trimeric intracellular cation channel family protein [Pseudomonas aromaticivorans]